MAELCAGACNVEKGAVVVPAKSGHQLIFQRRLGRGPRKNGRLGEDAR
jgi:hypothetical protein